MRSVSEMRCSTSVASRCGGPISPREKNDLGIGVSYARAASENIHNKYVVMLVRFLAVIFFGVERD